jgi:hypothetical protein
MDTQTILAEINKLNSELQKGNCAQSADLISTAERQYFAAETRQRHNTDHILDNLKDTDDEVKTAVERRGSEGTAAILTTSSQLLASQERLAAAGIVQAEKNTNELIGFANQEAVLTAKQYADTIYKLKDTEHNIGEYFNKTRVEILNVGSAIERQAAAQYAKTQADLFKIENSLGRQADSNFGAVQKQASDNYVAIQTEAIKMNNEMAKQIAECCCEVKQSVTTSEDNIKKLLNESENDELRARLLATENALVERAGAFGGPFDGPFDGDFGGFGRRGRGRRGRSRSRSRSRSRGSSSSHGSSSSSGSSGSGSRRS